MSSTHLRQNKLETIKDKQDPQVHIFLDPDQNRMKNKNAAYVCIAIDGSHLPSHSPYLICRHVNRVTIFLPFIFSLLILLLKKS